MEDPLTAIILDLIRRRRRITLQEIIRETQEEETRIQKILENLEKAGAIARHEETRPQPWYRRILARIAGRPVEEKIVTYYDLRPLRELVARRPGQRISERELAGLGIPPQVAVETGLLRETEQAGIYQIPHKIWRIQKMRAWRTEKNPWKYTISLPRRIKLPTQLILEGYAERQETTTLAEGVHGAVRIVVYTREPEKWPEARLERIMRGLFAQERITLEIYSNLPYVEKTQAYEAEDIDPDEKPAEIELDTPDVWLWISKDGETYAYHYIRRPWGWDYERYVVR